jgi:hypothetical protein
VAVNCFLGRNIYAGAERHKDASRIGLRTAQAGMISARTNGDKRRYAAKTSF